ncbi:MAG: hypothetical protein ACK500_01825 [Flavobacteriales bacterium]
MMIPLLFLLTLSGFVTERELPLTGDQLEMDEMGNIYTVTGQRLEKWTSDGKLMFRSADLNLGESPVLDLSNPLMPFAYYREQSKVVFLDNTLSQQGSTIDLFEKGFLQIEQICGSRGDAFWMWDARQSELIRVNPQFDVLSSTGNLGVVLGLELHPIQLLERGSSLYLVDPQQGILVFDVYGNYRTRLNVRTPYPIRVVDDHLLYIADNRLHILASNWLEEDAIPLPDTAFRSFSFARGKLYLAGEKTTRVYRYVADVKN